MWDLQLLAYFPINQLVFIFLVLSSIDYVFCLDLTNADYIRLSLKTIWRREYDSKSCV